MRSETPRVCICHPQIVRVISQGEGSNPILDGGKSRSINVTEEIQFPTAIPTDPIPPDVVHVCVARLFSNQYSNAKEIFVHWTRRRCPNTFQPLPFPSSSLTSFARENSRAFLAQSRKCFRKISPFPLISRSVFHCISSTLSVSSSSSLSGSRAWWLVGARDWLAAKAAKLRVRKEKEEGGCRGWTKPRRLGRVYNKYVLPAAVSSRRFSGSSCKLRYSLCYALRFLRDSRRVHTVHL